jgi:hypothetical protein
MLPHCIDQEFCNNEDYTYIKLRSVYFHGPYVTDAIYLLTAAPSDAQRRPARANKA